MSQNQEEGGGGGGGGGGQGLIEHIQNKTGLTHCYVGL